MLDLHEPCDFLQLGLYHRRVHGDDSNILVLGGPGLYSFR